MTRLVVFVYCWTVALIVIVTPAALSRAAFR